MLGEASLLRFLSGVGGTLLLQYNYNKERRTGPNRLE